MTEKIALYKQQVSNIINAPPSSAPHIGYLDDKNALDIQSTLTREDPMAYFKFRFRKGDTFRLATNMNKGVRVQLMDPSGRRVLADSSGTNTKLKAAYVSLALGTSKMKTGEYIIKTSYDTGVSRQKNLNLQVTLTSGPNSKAMYRTIAYPETVSSSITNGTFNNGVSPTLLAASISASAPTGMETTNPFSNLAGSYGGLNIYA